MKKLFPSVALFFKDYTPVMVLYTLVTIIVCMQSLLLPAVERYGEGHWYTQYNNFIIFKNSFFHLIHQQDIYALYTDEQYDLFKYSPAFALVFGLFAYVPDAIGLFLWNALNAFCFLYAIRQLPEISTKTKISILLFVLVELVTSLQNAQSNALLAGLLIMAFSRLEKGHYFLAALFITCTVFIKLFGVLAIGLYVFYPGKGKLIGYTIACFAFMTLLPGLVVPLDHLQFLYTHWFQRLVADHSTSFELSVISWFATWFHILLDKNLVVLVGAILLGLPILQRKKYKNYSFRLMTLCSFLLWMVIFNHMAESPTFIIAMGGVAIWYFSRARTVLNSILVISAFIFTSLSTTDVFPHFIQEEFFDPYVIKVVPCLFIWAKVLFDLWVEKDNVAPVSSTFSET